jgi:hypothetical protein
MSDQESRDAQRWRQIEDTCWKALDSPAHERSAVLDEACGDDRDLRHEVESLLAVQSAVPGFLETPAGDIAADLAATDDLTGHRLGPYLIGEWIGSGGMGDVYRARDEHLGRDVALKILPGVLADSGERSLRLLAEAQVVASLNHPNIAAIYGVEKSDGLGALVLELVDGPSLADRLTAGPVPIDEAVPIARQIAEGLEAAHERGIVHRDIKPSNIIVRHDGTVKLLDFGLATAFGDVATAGGAPGVLLGTPAYASPEQLKGRTTDRRTDIWAFGVVLYELLSGHRAFAGDSTSDIVSAVLQQRIDWSRLPATTPVPLRRLLARCLERDVRQRLRDIGEARIALEQIVPPLDGDAPIPAGTAAVAAGWGWRHRDCRGGRMVVAPRSSRRTGRRAIHAQPAGGAVDHAACDASCRGGLAGRPADGLRDGCRPAAPFDVEPRGAAHSWHRSPRRGDEPRLFAVGRRRRVLDASRPDHQARADCRWRSGLDCGGRRPLRHELGRRPPPVRSGRQRHHARPGRRRGRRADRQRRGR